MKKILPLVILFAALVYLTPLYPVYAKDATSSTSRISKLTDRLAVKEASREARLENFKERMASRAAMFKEKLADFKDKIKAQKVQRINDTLAKINKTRTDLMLRHYNKMNEILTSVEDRVNDAANNGKDMTSAKSYISQARTALDNAKKAIDAQADKDYTISINDETTVKTDALVQRQQLFTDLKSIHDLLIIAHQALAQAISQALSSIGGSK